ncbi:MAG: hypothetical protein DRQ13_00525 [Ignavibacteriae bacterium]|nr:MAG: hypothetical protein DRQ13_00525 [Ignavibacteriota bacterium]
MFNIKFGSFISLIIIPIAFISVKAQNQTVGLFLNDSTAFNGYTFFAPTAYTNTYLINNEGLLINSWAGSYTPALSAYLLKNGNLLRTATIQNATFNGGGSGGLIQEFEWEGNLVWEFEYSTDLYYQHHDIEKLPNGNILIIAWEYKAIEEVLGAGRNPSLLAQNFLWPDHIVEIQPDSIAGGNIVWEWHVWDHLIQDYDPAELNYGVVSEHPELVDINYVGTSPGATYADWNHINGVDYNEEFDQIILSVHKFSEIWVIDHSTTTEEAAGHTGGNSGMGGDLLYRWGNPQTYNRGNAADQKLFAQHDAHWIESGLPGEEHILIFNNGRYRPGGNYSSIDEIVPPVDQNGNYTLNPDSTFGPDTSFWSYTAPNPTEFFAANISGSQRQPNGNTLICDGPSGKFFEVTNEGEIVWLYINPVIATGPMTQGDSIPGQQNRVFRTYRYAPDYPGFNGKDLTPGDPIEIIISSIEGSSNDLTPAEFKLSQNYPNPFNPSTKIKYSLPTNEFVNITVYDLLGKAITVLINEQKPAGSYEIIFDASELPSGVYFYKLVTNDFISTKKMILAK